MDHVELGYKLWPGQESHMTPVHPYGPSACVPEYLSLENVMTAPQGPHLKPVGAPHPERLQHCLGFSCVICWSTLRTSCSFTGGRQEPGLLTQAALFCGFSGARGQRKHTLGQDPSHTTSHQSRNNQAMEEQWASLPSWCPLYPCHRPHACLS